MQFIATNRKSDANAATCGLFAGLYIGAERDTKTDNDWQNSNKCEKRGMKPPLLKDKCEAGKKPEPGPDSHVRGCKEGPDAGGMMYRGF
jgi:hypothetical protein